MRRSDVGLHQREQLERLCHDIALPALGRTHLRRTPARDAVLSFTILYRDSTTHLAMSLLEFLHCPRETEWKG